jgi:hypothetical protein
MPDPAQPLPQNPLIVQGDHTVLLEVDHPHYPTARDALARFAELVKSPEHIHTYRLTGMYGSRQEEAQRLGRILRPKPGDNQAYFYSIVSRDTVEQDFALKRQLFLCEQGYEYRIITLDHPDDSLP